MLFSSTSRISIEDRFFSKLPENRRDDDCWEWQGEMLNTGYGVISFGSQRSHTRERRLSHRVSWELLRGPIPDGLVIDHLCRNRRCVNPNHLEPVTNLENIQRGPAKQKTHCINGHAFDETNTYRYANGNRICRKCRAERMRRKNSSG